MGDKLKILIVTDKFKGSLNALEAAESIKTGLIKSRPDLQIELLPMADGGDGTLDVIKNAYGGEFRRIFVSDPLGREIFADYLVKENRIFIEMAKCSGLQLLRPHEYDPSKTTTYGLGQMIGSAVDYLASSGKTDREVIVGIGGSATNDGGMGMLRALGYRFTGRNGWEVNSLSDVAGVDDRDANKNLKYVKFKIACDVNNPLLGQDGATYVYAPQKGADKEMLEKLENEMASYAAICERHFGRPVASAPGAGAAGGTGFALMGFLKAEMQPGWKLLSGITGLENRIRDTDLVITGEGSVDKQSISGKLIYGIAEIASKYSKPLWAYCGINSLKKHQLRKAGVSKLFSISDIEKNKLISMQQAGNLLEKISYKSATFLDRIQSNRQTN